jgi:nitrate/TMAO reductase-like tetraheme cytochrome c subunit
MKDSAKSWMRPIVYLGQNPLSILGAVLTTSSALTLGAFWVFELLTTRPLPPYAGIVLFLVLPGVFLLGLILMPVGALRQRRLLKRQGKLPREYPRIDLRHPVLRRAAVLVAFATGINAMILGTASYLGVQYMDSAQFCGQSCHTVMAPEYTAYRDSPHSRVACVECHIGAGAPWFVRSKISGVRQVFAVALKTYSTPIPSPVEHLRPARETCERCHWPQRFVGDKLLVRPKFADDAANTKSYDILVVKIGGRTWQGAVGIHGRHLEHASRVSYVSTDAHRQVIPVVRYTDDSGKTIEYVSTDVKTTPEQLRRGEHRTMDCMDCHNRPSHTFQMPDKAVDRAMADGRISPDLPFVKKQAVALLKTPYPDRDTASAAIGGKLAEFYRTSYPEVYLGCFRCHDGSHQSKDGKVITQDCDACHALLAQDENNPKILAELGMK